MKWKIILFALLIVPIVYADHGHMKLLAVSETSQGLVGREADLDLYIERGEGRVFISTFPLTEIDTQISFRMAKEHACDFLDADCDNYDFYYIVESDSPIVGGPSAGGAATALTIIVLDDLGFDEKTAVTGTINSGGIIGTVAGLKQKINAASNAGLDKVLIPDGTRYAELNESNATLDLVEYGQEKGVEVREVTHIQEVVKEITGKEYPFYNQTPEIDEDYMETMKNVSERLCSRTSELSSLVNTSPEAAVNLTENAQDAQDKGSYYAAASYCFGANVQYQKQRLLEMNLTNESITRIADATQITIENLDNKISDIEYNTITDLQTYLIVKDRLKEANDHVDQSLEYLEDNQTNQSISQLAFAIERIDSARSWSEFFGMPGKEFNMDDKSMQNFCLDKISEARERLQYANSVLLIPLTEIKEDLDVARSDFENEEYELCIFRAAQAKARTSLILSSVGIQKSDVDRLLSNKLKIARNTIIKESKRDVFPILGYSYYEYSKSLSQEDPYSALLYAELSLELSNFDLYFNHDDKFVLPEIKILHVVILAAGIVIGYFLKKV